MNFFQERIAQFRENVDFNKKSAIQDVERVKKSHHHPSFSERCISFVNRVKWIAPLTGGVAAAVIPKAIQLVFYCLNKKSGVPVRFRGHEEAVLREILVDRDYGFLTDLLTATPEPTIIDVGSHIGIFPIWVYGINPQARVLSVEADPGTYEVAKLNSAAFTERGIDWEMIRGPAGSEDGSLLRLSISGPSISHRIDVNGTVEVRGISLTTLLDRLVQCGKMVDLVKIDIEGSEETFLCTEPEALKRVSALVIELHPKFCDINRVQRLLQEHFDCIEKIERSKTVKPLLYCRKSKVGCFT